MTNHLYDCVERPPKLEHVHGQNDVWFTTSGDIASWYLEHYYDDAVAALANRAYTQGARDEKQMK